MITPPPAVQKGKFAALYGNEAYRWMEGGVLIPSTGQMATTVPAASGTSISRSSPVLFIGSTEGFSEIAALVGIITGSTASAAARALIEVVDMNHGERRLSNRPFLAQHFFGTALNPNYIEEWSSPLVLRAQGALQLLFGNPDTTGTITISEAFQRVLYKTAIIQKQRRELMEQIHADLEKRQAAAPYWFVPDSSISANDQVAGLTIPAGGVRDCIFTNRTGMTLVLQMLLGTALADDDEGEFQEKVAFELFMPKTEMAMQNNPVTLNCGAGTSGFPHIFATPIIVENRESIRMKVTSLLATESVDFFPTFHGVALYPW